MRTTGKRVRGEARAEAALAARRRGVSQQTGTTNVGDTRGLAWLEDDTAGLQDDEVWPLQLIDLRDHDQVEEIYQLLRRTPPCIEWIEHQASNLGVGSSNLSGRANLILLYFQPGPRDASCARSISLGAPI